MEKEMNKVTLVGHLGNTPELRYTASGQPVCNFPVATNDRRTGQTQWHRIVVWGKYAQVCSEHLKKGSSVSIEGRISYRKWEDREGATRYSTEIVANDVGFLTRPKNEAGAQQQDNPMVDHAADPNLF